MIAVNAHREVDLSDGGRYQRLLGACSQRAGFATSWKESGDYMRILRNGRDQLWCPVTVLHDAMELALATRMNIQFGTEAIRTGFRGDLYYEFEIYDPQDW